MDFSTDKKMISENIFSSRKITISCWRKSWGSSGDYHSTNNKFMHTKKEDRSPLPFVNQSNL